LRQGRDDRSSLTNFKQVATNLCRHGRVIHGPVECLCFIRSL
jgi:hypothetical protein